MHILRAEASLRRDFGIYTSTYPAVPEAPVTLKLNCLLVESKISPERVELDVIEKTLCPS